MLGAEQVILALCRHSSRFGYDASLAVTHDRQDAPPALCSAARANGIDVAVIECRNRFDPRGFRALRALVDESGIDILHCHGYREDFYALTSRARTRKVTTNHLWKRTTPMLRLYAAVDSWLMTRFDRVVAVSREISSELESSGFSAPQLAYIPNGVDVDLFEPREESRASLNARKRELGIDGSSAVLTTTGSLTEEKGHRYLFEAVSGLADRRSDLRVLIVGDGPERAALLELVGKLGIEQAVRFVGRREDIADILSVTDVFALPSLKEGLPIALLEAMASGTACVATDVGDVGHVIEDGVTGLVVPKASCDELGDAIHRLIEDPSLRARLGAAARQRAVERFSSVRMAESYCALYDEIGDPDR